MKRVVFKFFVVLAMIAGAYSEFAFGQMHTV
jgi:hypothetical protein